MSLVAPQGGSGSDAVLGTAQSVEDFEQEIVDQYALAMVAAGLSDGYTRGTRAISRAPRPHQQGEWVSPP